MLYHLSSLRMQLRLSERGSSGAALLAVGGLFLRLTVLGLVVLALGLWTPLNIIALAVAFVCGFTLLTGVSLYRWTRGRGPLGTSTRVPH